MTIGTSAILSISGSRVLADMNTAITFEEYKAKVDELTVRAASYRELVDEAAALICKVQIGSFSEEQAYEACDLAMDLKNALNGEDFAFGPTGGFWVPSTCS